MTGGERIAKEACTWLGTPHVNGAKVKGKGVDCGMLLIGSAEGAGLIEKNSIKITPYSNEWHLHRNEEWFLRYVQEHCEKVDEMQKGDFLLFQYGRCISHGAVYIGNNMVIHAVVNQGVIMSELDDVMFFDAKGEPRLRAVYRYKGV